MRACRNPQCGLVHDPLIDCRVVAARLKAAGSPPNQPKQDAEPKTGLRIASPRHDQEEGKALVPAVTHSAEAVTHNPDSVTHNCNAQEPTVTHKRTNAERQHAYREANQDQVRARNRERMAAKRRRDSTKTG